MNTISTATKDLKIGDRIIEANTEFTVTAIRGDEISLRHHAGDEIQIRSYRVNLVKADDNEWGDPDSQDPCDCGATETTNGQCQDCQDDYEATIDWVTR
jgi:hypothetical protein